MLCSPFLPLFEQCCTDEIAHPFREISAISFPSFNSTDTIYPPTFHLILLIYLLIYSFFIQKFTIHWYSAVLVNKIAIWVQIYMLIDFYTLEYYVKKL